MAITSAWSRRQTFVVLSASLPSSPSNMTAYLTSANTPEDIFIYAKSDGSDIRFTSDISGTNELPVEVVFYDNVNRWCEICVNVPNVSNIANTPFHCWYGNTSATFPDASASNGRNAVWTAVNATAVHHFHETSGAYINSVGTSAYDGNVSGTVHRGEPVLDPDNGQRCVRLDRTEDSKIVLNSNAIPEGQNRTIMCWVWLDSYGGLDGDGRGRIISEETSGGTGHTLAVDGNGGNNRLLFNGSSDVVTTTDSMPLNEWKHVALSYTNSTTSSNIRMYVDGVLEQTASQDIENGGQNTVIGARDSVFDRNFDGYIDELQIYNLVESDNSVLIAYRSQAAPEEVVTTSGSVYVINATENVSGSEVTASLGTMHIEIVASDPSQGIMGQEFGASLGSMSVELSANVFVSGITIDAVAGTPIASHSQSISGVNIGSISVGSVSATVSPIWRSNLIRASTGYVDWVDTNVYGNAPPITKRYRKNKKLNLTNFLPSMYQETETEQFTQVLEDFLNTLFDGGEGATLSASEISVSGNYRLSGVSGDLISYEYTNPIHIGTLVNTDAEDVESVAILSATDTSNKISVIEKVYRLTELKDPDLIDIDDIQYFANNAGYNVDVYRPEFGNVSTATKQRPLATSATSASYVDSYLRFNVSNMPEWYKIKTTDNSIQVLLFSYGLIGNVIKYYTDNYYTDISGGSWIGDFDGTLEGIPKNFYATPHFAVRVLVDRSEDLIGDATKRSSVIRAIQSIQPINTVFRNLSGYVAREFHVQVQVDVRKSRYIRVVNS